MKYDKGRYGFRSELRETICNSCAIDSGLIGRNDVDLARRGCHTLAAS